MATRFISDRTTTLYKQNTGGARHTYLKLGDPVAVAEPPIVHDLSGRRSRTQVQYGRHQGWVASEDLTDDATLEMYFYDVGQGDSALIITPSRRKILIDGGKNGEAHKALRWGFKLAEPGAAEVHIDLLVLSHGDEDHVGGLVDLIADPLITIGRIVQPGTAKFSGGHDTELGNQQDVNGELFLTTLHTDLGHLKGKPLTPTYAAWKAAIEAEQAAHGTIYETVDHRTGALPLGDPDVTVTIIGPVTTDIGAGQRGLKWFKDPAHTVNGHSVVMLLQFQNFRALFPGDVNTQGTAHLLASPGVQPQLGAHVLKAPHHGSHEFDQAFLDAVRPQATVVSSGDSNTHGHPRPVFLGSAGRYSRGERPQLFSTELLQLFGKETDVDIPPNEAAAFNAGDQPTVDAHAFRKKLNGMVNIRTNGIDLFTAVRTNHTTRWISNIEPLVP